MRISCIIPTFNRGGITCDTVEQLLDQEHPAHEIIVIDQSTVTPKSARLRREAIVEANPKVKWLRQEEPNASMARNRGAVEATGDVMLFLDDDIAVKPGFLAAHARAFVDPAVRGAVGQILEGKDRPVDELPALSSDPHVGWLYFDRRYSKPTTTNFLMSGNLAVRRADFFAVGGMDENYEKGAFREETDFGRRWALSGRKIHFLPDASLLHLGAAAIPGGGARAFWRPGPAVGWHHYVSTWYFFVGFADRHSWWHLLRSDLGAAGLRKTNLKKPWWIPVCMAYWLCALPVAAWRRIRGPRLAKPPVSRLNSSL